MILGWFLLTAPTTHHFPYYTATIISYNNVIPVLISSCSSASTLSGIDTGTTENRDVLESAAEPVGVDEDESFGKCGALLSTVILCGS